MLSGVYIRTKPAWNKGKKYPQISGEKHYNWKGGKPKCINCSRKISYLSVRCINCAGETRTYKNNSNWKGGKFKQDGYVYIYKPNHPFAIKNYVLEHRFMMEKYLGRFLKPKEIVHHKNGIKDDNRIINLKLFSSNSKHIGIHMFGNKFAKGNKPNKTSFKKDFTPWNKGKHIKKYY